MTLHAVIKSLSDILQYELVGFQIDLVGSIAVKNV